MNELNARSARQNAVAHAYRNAGCQILRSRRHSNGESDCVETQFKSASLIAIGALCGEPDTTHSSRHRAGCFPYSYPSRDEGGLKERSFLDFYLKYEGKVNNALRRQWWNAHQAAAVSMILGVRLSRLTRRLRCEVLGRARCKTVRIRCGAWSTSGLGTARTERCT